MSDKGEYAKPKPRPGVKEKIVAEAKAKNKLYFGDCLHILKELAAQHPDGFIDLIYIDPPFNSKRNYNILYEEADMKDVKAQKEAFADTWSNVSYKDTLQELQEIDLDLFNFLKALDNIRVSKSAVSYLTMMAIRIHYMHKVLNDRGSFYLHCDSTMSSYLRLVCDLIFGEKNFRNEISWKRSSAHNDSKSSYGNITDVILFYTKTLTNTFNKQYTKYSEKYLSSEWNELPSARFYKAENMLDPQNSMEEYDFHGTTARWRTSRDKFELLWNAPQTEVPNSHGRIKLGKDGNPTKRCRIVFLDELPGVSLQDMWDDIPYLAGGAKEALGYPTQKPVALLERIISASTNEKDLVADFFCGCGTSIAAAQHLKRKWLGVDISHLAVGLIERRLLKNYPEHIKGTYEIDGFPMDVGSAKKLAEGVIGGRLKFQDWIIEAKLGGVCNPKKTADGGWDGHMTFEIQKGTKTQKETVLIEVKSGNVNVKNVREFIHVVQKEKASMGLFVCFAEQITKPMQLAAKEEGYFSPDFHYDKIQLITVEDLLEGIMPKMPESTKTTFKQGTRKSTAEGEQQKLL